MDISRIETTNMEHTAGNRTKDDDCPVVVGGDTASFEGIEGYFDGETSVYFDGALAERPTPYVIESSNGEEAGKYELTHDQTPILFDEIDPDNTVRFGFETGPFV